MNTSNSIGALAKALAAAQGKLKGAVKDANNPFFKSKYADLSSVWDACRAALSENGIAVIQAPKTVDATVTVETLLLHESGEWASESLSATAKDDSPQSIGSTVTYLRRYGLASMVGVAPEDDDAESAQPRAHAPPSAKPSAARQTVDAADKAYQAKLARLKALADLHQGNFKAFVTKTLGREVAHSVDLTADDLDKLEAAGDVP